MTSSIFQFSYCPLIWIFRSKGCNKRIDRIHERSLESIFNDYKSLFNMISNLNEKTIHQRCIHILLTKVYKYLNGLFPKLMNEVFYLRQNQYNLHKSNVFAMDNPRDKLMSNSTVYWANQLWQSLFSKVKSFFHYTFIRTKSKFDALIDTTLKILLKVTCQCKLFLALLLPHCRNVAKLRTVKCKWLSSILAWILSKFMSTLNKWILLSK